MTDNTTVLPSSEAGSITVATDDVSGVHYPIYKLATGGDGVANEISSDNPIPIHTGNISSENSSATLLTNGSVFTGTWVDVSKYSTVTVAVKTDQDGTFSVQFSPDGTNQDSTLTRYYRTGQIEAPHNFTITRQYMRVVFTNDSGSDQTYFRLQTLLGEKPQLNAPLDSTLAVDFDAIATRPSDFHTEVALGRRQGIALWNKFGYNADIDISSSPEVIAAFGGTFTVNTTASTLSIVSSDAADDGDPAGTGCNSVVVTGVDSNWDTLVEVVTLNGTGAVTTSGSFVGVNRVAMFLCGSGQTNAGLITVTKTTGGATVATMPAGEGVTQQCIFYVPQNHQFLAEWMTLNAVKPSGQDPIVTWILWVYSVVNNGKQEVFRYKMDTAVEVHAPVEPNLPFPIGEKSIVWLEATTNKDNTECSARFSGELFKDVDA